MFQRLKNIFNKFGWLMEETKNEVVEEINSGNTPAAEETTISTQWSIGCKQEIDLVIEGKVWTVRFPQEASIVQLLQLAKLLEKVVLDIAAKNQKSE